MSMRRFIPLAVVVILKRNQEAMIPCSNLEGRISRVWSEKLHMKRQESCGKPGRREEGEHCFMGYKIDLSYSNWRDLFDSSLISFLQSC
jgi:hypothetical protein